MNEIIVECKQCGSNEYLLVSEQTGEVRCPYCRNNWIEPKIAQSSLFSLYAARTNVIKHPIALSEKERLELSSGFRKALSRTESDEEEDKMMRNIRARVISFGCMLLFMIIALIAYEANTFF